MGAIRRIVHVVTWILGVSAGAFAIYVAAFVISQNYAIGREESINGGDTIQEVESKKGLLRSKQIGLEDVSPAYYSENWTSIVRDHGGTLRSYYMIGPSFIRPSGFVVVFDGEGKVFLVIPTDT